MHKSKRNIIFVVPFILPWDRPADYQRQTCLELAKRHRVIAYTQTDAIYFLKALWQKKPAYPIVKNVRFYRPLYWFPFRRFQYIEKINQRLAYMLFELSFLWKKRIVLWIFDPSLYWLTHISRGFSLYDCVDFHSGFHIGRKRTEIQKQEQELIIRVSRFFVNSHGLYDIHKKIRKPDGIAPQGFKLDDFRNPTPSVVFSTVKPIIGYVGAIDYRLDVLLLEKLIRGNPRWQFVLWGPLQTSHGILGLPNVIIGESADRHESASIIKQFDIGIIPFDITLPGARISYPMKLFEYFYMGKPVVSAPIEELMRFSKFLKIADSVQEWEEHIVSILSKPWPNTYQREQRNLAINNSWDKKIQKIFDII